MVAAISAKRLAELFGSDGPLSEEASIILNILKVRGILRIFGPEMVKAVSRAREHAEECFSGDVAAKFPHNAETADGYLNRRDLEFKPSQQEAVVFPQGVDGGMPALVGLGRMVARRLAEGKEVRERAVLWRYRTDNLPAGGEGFGMHTDFSMLGVTWQSQPGLVNANSELIYLSGSALVTLGDGAEPFGGKPFVHGVASHGNVKYPRYAGGVFFDAADAPSLATQLETFHS